MIQFRTLEEDSMDTFPEVTDVFLCLASAPKEMSTHTKTMSTIERFAVLLYDRTCTCSDVNMERKKGFLQIKDDQLREYLQHWQLLKRM